MHVYIELFKAKDAWLELTAEERAAYMQKAGSTMQGALDAGAELVGVGAANPETSHDAGYDFYAVWRLPNPDVVQMFEKGIEDDDWYAYFEQLNASGELMEFDALIKRVIELSGGV
jgi:hypothetical protein